MFDISNLFQNIAGEKQIDFQSEIIYNVIVIPAIWKKLQWGWNRFFVPAADRSEKWQKERERKKLWDYLVLGRKSRGTQTAMRRMVQAGLFWMLRA
ncbi:MAG: hypothetical protein K2N63_09370 [Lachnospiraceae bacterium]|nr:hypothetical protein [Lachnospiraceae bacterium]